MAVDILNTKFSDIDLTFVKSYLRVDFDEDDAEIAMMMEAAKAFFMKRLDKTVEEFDFDTQINIAYLLLVSSFYKERMMSNDKKYIISPTFETIINNILGLKL